jgi:hypothetical protein
MRNQGYSKSMQIEMLKVMIERDYKSMASFQLTFNVGKDHEYIRKLYSQINENKKALEIAYRLIVDNINIFN